MDLSTHGIVALVRDGNGRFLMLEDARDPMRGLWAPPHGRCEITDGSEEASVIREVREETGLLVRPIHRILTQPADSKVSTVSFWIVDSESNTPILNEESSSFGWFNVEEILTLKLYPGTKLFFDEVQAGRIVL